MVEGLRRRASVHNHSHHRVQIPQYVASGYTQDEFPLSCHPVIANLVANRAIVPIMRFTINFDR
jgi:hypothetical protein